MQTVSVEAAVAKIPNGASLMVGGFMGVGTPERLIDELVRQGKRDLTVIANDTCLPARGIGKLRRTGPMIWVMPLPANIVLRNFGLAIFLAAVGINAGQPFVRTVSESGLLLLLIGAAILLTTVAIVLLAGHYLLKVPFDDLVGVASGATGNPAILVYSTRMAPTERPDIGYAMIFPSMTIVKVISVQIVGLVAASGAGG